MDMKELRKNAEKVIAERFPDFNFSTLDWGELDPFYLEHPEENQIYEEVGPLLSKIYKQNRQIKSQLEAARRNQEEFGIITENMQEGLLVIDSYTMILSGNSSAWKLFQLKDPKIGDSVYSLNRNEDFRLLIEQVLKGQHGSVLLHMGSEAIQMIANPVNREHRVVGAVILLMNETEKVEREQLRREFSANVSHELRSPLSSIRGFLEAMEDGTIPTDEHEKYIEIVLDETRRMSGMVNDLLDIARIESGQYKLNLSVFDINDLIGRVLITFEARITAKHADVDAQLDYEPVFVEADRDRIGQVLHNLIDNAIKFMPENDGLLTIKSVVSKHKVYVSVCDNGPGIPKEDIAHIFDRFYKAEKAHTYKNGSGTGLGLSIVKLVIDQHHGEIKAESSENGTVFTFSLKQALPPPRRQPAAE